MLDKTKVTRASQDVTGTLAPKQILILQIVFKFFKTEKNTYSHKILWRTFGDKSKGNEAAETEFGF